MNLVLILVLFVVVGWVLFSLVYFPIVYGSKSPSTPENTLQLRRFTAEASAELSPWCVTTRYSIAYVRDRVQGPWSDFSGDVRSLTRTFPLVEMGPPPDPAWGVIVQRVEVVDGNVGTPHVIEPQWQPDSWSFVDEDNPCTSTYEPPRPEYPPVPIEPGDDPTWLAPAPPEMPWCVGTRYRSIFLGAFGKHGPWSPWSSTVWQALDRSLPTFLVSPPPPDQSSLWTYWVPSYVALPADPSLSFTIARAGGSTTHSVPWPFDPARSTVDYIAQYATRIFAGLGLNLTVVFNLTGCVANLFGPGTSPDVISVRFLGQANDILGPLGFGNQVLVRLSYVTAERPVSWMYTIENGNVFTPEFLCDPFEVQIDRVNLCVEGELPQPDAPSSGSFTVDLANPAQTRTRSP
jgi:hypothetical protein